MGGQLIVGQGGSKKGLDGLLLKNL